MDIESSQTAMYPDLHADHNFRGDPCRLGLPRERPFNAQLAEPEFSASSASQPLLRLAEALVFAEGHKPKHIELATLPHMQAAPTLARGDNDQMNP